MNPPLSIQLHFDDFRLNTLFGTIVLNDQALRFAVTIYEGLGSSDTYCISAAAPQDRFAVSSGDLFADSLCAIIEPHIAEAVQVLTDSLPDKAIVSSPVGSFTDEDLGLFSYLFKHYGVELVT